MLGGASALVASAFLHWVRQGPGSSLRGHDLVDVIVALGDTLPGLSAARLTVLWYLVPGLGAATWIAVGLVGSQGRVARLTAWAATIVTVVVIVTFARLAGLGDLGAGALVAGLGALALAGGAMVPTP
jgi:hypothetical protein